MKLTPAARKLKQQLAFLEGLSDEELNIAAIGVEEDLSMAFKKGLCIKNGWKETLSDDLTTHKYREPETGKYYETNNILKYLGDCKKRQQFDYTKDINDFELVHHDSKQKLFFVASSAFQDHLPETIDLMKKWIFDEFGTEPHISTGMFEKILVIMFENIAVDNFKQKIEVLSKMQKALPDGIRDILSGYLAKEESIYEEIPSITNSDYGNEVTIDLIASDYSPPMEIVKRIKELTPSLINAHTVNINIVINNITNNYGVAKSSYEVFIDHILNDKPDWYRSGVWLPKQILADKYNEMNGTSIGTSYLTRYLKSEGLFQKICIREKRARYNGSKHPVRLFLTK